MFGWDWVDIVRFKHVYSTPSPCIHSTEYQQSDSRRIYINHFRGRQPLRPLTLSLGYVSVEEVELEKRTGSAHAVCLLFAFLVSVDKINVIQFLLSNF